MGPNLEQKYSRSLYTEKNTESKLRHHTLWNSYQEYCNMLVKHEKSLADRQLTTFAHPLLHHVRGVRDGVRQSPRDWSICQPTPSCVTPVTRGHGSADILPGLADNLWANPQNISSLRLKSVNQIKGLKW